MLEKVVGRESEQNREEGIPGRGNRLHKCTAVRT